MTLITAQKSFRWRCRVLRMHQWVTRSTDDGSRYQACRLCGEDRGEVSFGQILA